MEGSFGVPAKRFLTPNGGILLLFGSGAQNDILRYPKNLRSSASSADKPLKRQAAKKNFLFFSYFLLLTSYLKFPHLP